MKKGTLIAIISATTIFAVALSLICLAPIFTKNSLVKQINLGDYSAANDTFKANWKITAIKDEAENLLTLLEGRMDEISAALHNEEDVYNEAEDISNLYLNICTAYELPLDRGEALKSTINMYRELGTLRDTINDKDYTSAGKALLSSSFSGESAYVEYLSRYINDSNKRSMVVAIEAAVDSYTGRAKSSNQFAQMPSFFSNGNRCAAFLLDAPSRERLMNKITTFNKTQTCAYDGCNEWAVSKYCIGHKCGDNQCGKVKSEGSDYCGTHTCIVADCNGYSSDSDYCNSHECKAGDCKKFAGDNKYCSYHYNQAIDEVEKGKTNVSFTNKYGTVGTKCSVAGCNFTIASSGDTNCCTTHSNRCGSCDCYIDGDAMYCTICLAVASLTPEPEEEEIITY